MRALFLLMVAVNVGYFAWETVYAPKYAESPEASAPVSSRAGDTLVLLSEAPEVAVLSERPTEIKDPGIVNESESPKPPREPSTPAAEDTSPVKVPAQCYRIAGIEKKTEADVLTAALQQHGARLSG